MANNTNWGGARPGAGRKRKAAAERLMEGRDAAVIKFPETPAVPEAPDIKDYLSDEQRLGELHAREIYEETWKFLRDRGCLHLINPHLIEQYSLAFGRYIQLEKIQSEFGPVTKQINGEMKASPFVGMAINYLKEARVLWNEIWYIIQSNCTEKISDDPQDDLMEKLLKL